MPETIVKTTFSEFKKFLETAPDFGRVADCWTVDSYNPGFSSHMSCGGDETEILISRIKKYKMTQHDWYDDAAADFIYILNPYDEDFTDRWDEAIKKLLAGHPGKSDESKTWREKLEDMIPEKPASQLDDFVYNDGKSSDFLNFACDVIDIREHQWSTLFASRA
jgi:hypothetical protein